MGLCRGLRRARDSTAQSRRLPGQPFAVGEGPGRVVAVAPTIETRFLHDERLTEPVRELDRGGQGGEVRIVIDMDCGDLVAGQSSQRGEIEPAALVAVVQQTAR